MPDLDIIESEIRKQFDRLAQQRAQLDQKEAEIKGQLDSLEVIKNAWKNLQQERANGNEQVPNVEPEQQNDPLNPKVATLEVIKTFKEPLRRSKIVEELIAVGFQFDSDPPQVVGSALEGLLTAGEIRREGRFFFLPSGNKRQ